MAVSYMRQHPTEFNNFQRTTEIDELRENNIPGFKNVYNYDQYLAAMEQDGTWGSGLEVQVLNLVLNKKIDFRFTGNNSTLDPNAITLQFINGNHYNLLLPRL